MPFQIVSHASFSLYLPHMNWKTSLRINTKSLKKLKARDKRIADLQAAVEEASASAASTSAPSNAARAAEKEQQLEAAAARAEALETKLKVRA